MVWSRLNKLVCICLLLCLVMAMPLQAQASTYSPYTDGNIGSNQLQYFRDIVSNLGINESYVAARTDRYKYQLFVGDIKYSNGNFLGNQQGSVITVYTINTDTSTYGTYTYSVSNDNNFTFNASNYLVYSNLGDYPQLEERSVLYEFSTLFIISVVSICALLRSVFSFVYRTRSNK